jgi:hypothetical protein
VGKPKGKRPLGRPRCREENILKMDLQEVRLGRIDWIDLAQNRDRQWALVNAVPKLWVLYNAGNFLTSREPDTFSRRTLLHAVVKERYVS